MVPSLNCLANQPISIGISRVKRFKPSSQLTDNGQRLVQSFPRGVINRCIGASQHSPPFKHLWMTKLSTMSLPSTAAPRRRKEMRSKLK